MMRLAAIPILVGAMLSAGGASAAQNGLSAAPFAWGAFGGGLTFSRVYVSSLVNPDGSAGGAIQTVTAPSSTLLSAYRTDFPGATYQNGVIAYTGPVPEPETWALILAGLGLVGGATRRRGQASAKT